MRQLKCFSLLLVLLTAAPVGATHAPATQPTTGPTPSFEHTWLLHLPGIGGEMHIDHGLINGLKDGGWEGPTKIYDWTEHDPGLDALMNRKRNEREAKIVSQMIEDKLRTDPKLQITVTSHSGGTGIAIWALEKLPDNFQIQTLVLLASAVSPEYDLSKALKHVRGNALVFYSENDALVLGVGTKMFGTIDGKKGVSGGLIGFTPPPDADKRQYEKLAQFAYDRGWMALGNIGNHVGCMSHSFARGFISPLLIEELAQAEGLKPTTRPTTRPAVETAPDAPERVTEQAIKTSP